MFTRLIPLLALVALASCTDIDPDLVSDGDPIYYLCENTEEDCANGFICVDDLVWNDGRKGICLRDEEPVNGCHPFLENLEGTNGDRDCGLPLQCPSDGPEGILLPGDANGCPAGFAIEYNNGNEGNCVFSGCAPGDGFGTSYTLVNLGEGACYDNDVDGTGPFRDGHAAKIYCELEAGDKYPGCPAGWVFADSHPCGPGGTQVTIGDFCVINASTPLAPDDTITDELSPVDMPLTYMPLGSGQSCRPLP